MLAVKCEKLSHTLSTLYITNKQFSETPTCFSFFLDIELL